MFGLESCSDITWEPRKPKAYPLRLIACGAYAPLLTLCCLLSLFSNFWPAVVSWLGVLANFTISWKVDATWLFRAQLIPCLRTPVVLALVAHVARREQAESEVGDG